VIPSILASGPIGEGPLAFNNAIIGLAFTLITVFASLVCLGVDLADSKNSKITQQITRQTQG
jgi:hypothetical protein